MTSLRQQTHTHLRIVAKSNHSSVTQGHSLTSSVLFTEATKHITVDQGASRLCIFCLGEFFHICLHYDIMSVSNGRESEMNRKKKKNDRKREWAQKKKPIEEVLMGALIYENHLLWGEMCECEKERLTLREKKDKEEEGEEEKEGKKKRKGWDFLASPFCSLIKLMTHAGTREDITCICIHSHLHTHTVHCNCPKPSSSISQTAHGCSTASLSPLRSPSLWASSLTSLSVSLLSVVFSSLPLPLSL